MGPLGVATAESLGSAGPVETREMMGRLLGSAAVAGAVESLAGGIAAASLAPWWSSLAARGSAKGVGRVPCASVLLSSPVAMGTADPNTPEEGAEIASSMPLASSPEVLFAIAACEGDWPSLSPLAVCAGARSFEFALLVSAVPGAVLGVVTTVMAGVDCGFVAVGDVAALCGVARVWSLTDALSDWRGPPAVADADAEAARIDSPSSSSPLAKAAAARAMASADNGASGSREGPARGFATEEGAAVSSLSSPSESPLLGWRTTEEGPLLPLGVSLMADESPPKSDVFVLLLTRQTGLRGLPDLAMSSPSEPLKPTVPPAAALFATAVGFGKAVEPRRLPPPPMASVADTLAAETDPIEADDMSRSRRFRRSRRAVIASLWNGRSSRRSSRSSLRIACCVRHHSYHSSMFSQGSSRRILKYGATCFFRASSW